MFLDIICMLILIWYTYHMHMSELWKFNNGLSLNYKKDKKQETILSIIYLMAFLYVPDIIQIIFIVALIISVFGLYAYIYIKNKTVNKDNPSLQELYISEIKKDIRNICICLLIISAILIAFNRYFI